MNENGYVGARTRSRGREAVGAASALLNVQAPGVWQLDSSNRVRRVAEKKINVPNSGQFSYRPTRRRIAISESSQYHILDFAGTAGSCAFSGGTTKLAGSQMQVTFFEKIGLGQWFRYFTGGLEVIGAILVLVPRTAVVGAVLLGMTMVGAVNIHLLITGGSPVPSVVLLVIAVAITWYRELYLKSANNNPSKLVDNRTPQRLPL